jgi:hypothetical protein
MTVLATQAILTLVLIMIIGTISSSKVGFASGLQPQTANVSHPLLTVVYGDDNTADLTFLGLMPEGKIAQKAFANSNLDLPTNASVSFKRGDKFYVSSVVNSSTSSSSGLTTNFQISRQDMKAQLFQILNSKVLDVKSLKLGTSFNLPVPKAGIGPKSSFTIPTGVSTGKYVLYVYGSIPDSKSTAVYGIIANLIS